MEAQLMADADGITERLERVQLPPSISILIFGRSFKSARRMLSADNPSTPIIITCFAFLRAASMSVTQMQHKTRMSVRIFFI